MMYFTENDVASCDNPLELNDEFEAQYDTAEYEAKTSRLLHHAYNRLKVETPERKRNWDEAVTFSKGDHYFLVLWDMKPRNEHPTRDTFKLLGTGLMVATVITIAAVLAAKYNVDVERYRKYLLVVSIGLFLLVTGMFRLLYRLAVVWLHRRTAEDKEQN